ncbi:MAG: carbamoyltransferase HypF [Planctomycetia bacterium]|jgi:hydrogenase maturation protein HypF
MNRPADENVTLLRKRITVRGVIQGVGFRPFLWRLAHELALTGWVRNEADRVLVEIQGPVASLECFEAALGSTSPTTPSSFPLPEAAQVESVESQPCKVVRDEAEFTIVTSQDQGNAQPVIPADLATCTACLAEIRSPDQRRFAYPFTNCTHCGPRWSIVEGLPYDRARTSMASFELCEDCRREYEDPGDRRFHAQPVACPVCGPELRLLDARSGSTLAKRDEALAGAVNAIRSSQIVALKGLGGFQLLADATDESAVWHLRDRKCRPDKPLAIMLPDLESVQCYCHVSEEEAQLLTSPAAPIVLLKKIESSLAPSRATGKVLAENIAPGNPELGVMLPYTPLHHLLMAELRTPIICTSGNLSEEPMAIRTAEAVERLGRIADVILTHNRPIVRPVDDSVTRCISTGVQILRRARGYAPAAIASSKPSQIILAVGGHLKNTIGLKLDDRIVIGSHIGDLETVKSIEVHRRAIDDLIEFFGVTPEQVACDLHPDYRSTQLAEQLAERWAVPLVRVQHHHAHVAAVAAEHGLAAGDTLGFAWDGTGFGPDGTVWGGEVLIDRGADFDRFARLRPFSLPGSDRAVREPRRSAFGLLHEIDPVEAARRAANWFNPDEFAPLTTILERQVHSPRTSSLGRLFDAVAMLCLARPTISFEGQAAMELEFAADPKETSSYRFEIVEKGKGEPLTIDWQPMLDALLDDLDRGIKVSTISARFHNGLADVATALAVRSGMSRVILSGGCFLNRRLLESTRQRLLDTGLEVYLPEQFPPGDGSISLGQLTVTGYS